MIINGIPAGFGIGYSKKESQQSASKIALKKIKLNKDMFLKPIEQNESVNINDDKEQHN